MKKDEAHKIDLAVGKALRQQRKLLRLSQGGLGEPIGIAFQQVQKYERGTNRLSVSTLVLMEREAGISSSAVLAAARWAHMPEEGANI